MTRLTALPASLRPWHPIAFIATWFGSGLLPKAPGTWGTAAAMPPALVICLLGGPTALLIAALLAFAVGIWAADAYSTASKKPDPSEVVIDEVAAMWLTLAFLPFSWGGWILGFIAFRVFDVLKPYPIHLADAKLKGGFGIMFDDVIAAIYAMLATSLLLYLIKAL